ncbi:alpha/beta hydrolase [Eudoraea sp.]|uniref:alpha/beta hydrolase n=1 Tax=Eudoraea sp. TaxID=1979955 RepID=UPI003C78091B
MSNKPLEKSVRYSSTNTYETLNELTDITKNVWIVFHGIGYLSKYFLKYFDELNPEDNYIIAPQAPSKYYLNNSYKHVGASWLTKENTETEIINNLNYLDAILEEETILSNRNLIIFGYSQGVSMAARWVAQRKIVCNQLVLYAGGIPNELNATDFTHLGNTTQITIIIGNKDEYLTKERLSIEREKSRTIFNGKAKEHIFDGGHIVKKELINSLII